MSEEATSSTAETAETTPDRSSTEEAEPDEESLEVPEKPRGAVVFSEYTEVFINYVEMLAAAVFALLFAIGVGDLMLQIADASLDGSITDPLVVIGFIDTGLLLLIIVEVYQTVAAYVNRRDRRDIVRLVVFTGVIAMVRKVIIFRTSEYASTTDALIAAVAYTVIIAGLVALLATGFRE